MAALLVFPFLFTPAASAQNTITTVAGGGANSSVATSAVILEPSSVATDRSGNVFVASYWLAQVFKVDSAGNITIAAGNGTWGYSGPGGPATSASLNSTVGIALDSSGNLFISEFDGAQILRVDAATGILTIAAGNGTNAYSGDGGPATSASLNHPWSVAVDASGNLFIADAYNQRIRRVDGKTGSISTVAGNGTQDFSGDGGPATSASLNYPYGVAVDTSGNLFIADSGNGRVRRVDAATGTITTVAGGGNGGDGGPATSAGLYPLSVAVDSSGNLFIADGWARIRLVDAATGIITTVAGNGTNGYSGDGGPATSASLGSPVSVAVDNSGNFFIADRVSQRLRRVDAATGIITTVAGGGSDGDGGPATKAFLYNLYGLAEDNSGNLFISDTYNGRIRRVDEATGIISTVAGNGTALYGGDGGTATSASLNFPYGLAVDTSGNLFITDRNNSVVRRVDAASGIITTVAGGGGGGDGGPATGANLSGPGGAAVDGSGNLFIADSGNNRIRRVDAVTGIITTVAGNGTGGYSGDGGPATSASLNSPWDVALDASGNLFIADFQNNCVRRVDAVTGVITTVAGNGTYGFTGDGGPATSASLSHISGVAVDSSGNLFIADTYNCRTRRVDAVTGIIITVAGNGAYDFTGDGGPATSASLNGPWAVVVGSSNDLFIADTDNNRIRQVVLTPIVGFSSASLSFPSQTVGKTSPAQTVTVTNAGGANLVIRSIVASSNFGQTNNCPTSPTTLNPGSTCTIRVTFAPTAPGSPTGAITVIDNAYNSPQSVTLAGIGTSPVPAWHLVPGLLSQVSVGSDGTVWGVNSAGQAFWFNAQTQAWQQCPGSFTQVAVGSSGFVWGLNASGQVYRYDPATQNWDQIPGTFSQISVGSDGDVWGIGSAGQIFHFDAALENWVQIPGALAQIAVGYDGAIWGLNAAQQIFRFNPGTQAWQQVPGALAQIAVGADGDVWGLNAAQQIFHFNPGTQGWQQIPGLLNHIAVGSGSNVWGLNAAGQIFEFNPSTQGWKQTPGVLAQIAVGANGAVWGLNSADQIFEFVQPTAPTQTLHSMPGVFVQIAVGLDGDVWGIDNSQQIWRFDAHSQSWKQITGALTQIRVGFGGNVWGLNAAGEICRFIPSTQGWESIPGVLAQLAVGADGSVWGLNSAQEIFRFNPSTQGWELIPGLLAQLAVGADGTVWGLNSAQEIFRFNSSTQGWKLIPGRLAQIAVGSANNVWGLNAAGQIYRYDPELQAWVSVPGELTTLAVAFDGAVWGLNSANQIFRYDAQQKNWNLVPGLLSQISVGADAVVWGMNANGQTYTYW